MHPPRRMRLPPLPEHPVTDTPYGRLELRSYPTCPECGADWPLDNNHIRDGHCPGRPASCTCDHDMQYHRPPQGCWTRAAGRCGCLHNQHPVNWATHDGNYARKDWWSEPPHP